MVFELNRKLGLIESRFLSDLEKSRRDDVPSVFLSPAEKNGFPFIL